MKVQVLMSTYNGEKYIREQIDSILNQKGIEVNLLIRDDGSSDNTVKIIQEYAGKDSRVTVYSGANLKSAKSFFDLVAKAGNADYYAFSDQDDVWALDKIEAAVKTLSTKDNTKPLLYYCNMKVVDENLNFLYLLHAHNKRTDYRYSVLTEYYAAGCTMVFNEAAQELCSNHIPQGNIMHDTWMEVLCQFFGTVYYDPNAYIFYRQHSNNVIGVPTSKLQRIQRKISRVLSDSKQPRYEFAKIIDANIGSILSPKDAAEVKKIVNYKNSFIDWMTLLFDRSIKNSSVKDELTFRMLTLIRRA